MTRTRRLFVIAAYAFLAVLFLLSFARDSGAGPHVDEVEYLHAAYRMAHGDRVFVDFAEHHSPLFFTLLVPLAPDGNSIAETKRYVFAARVFTRACALLALLFAALIFRRASGRDDMTILFIALVFSAGAVWNNGLGDVRAESPALALWWGGAALVLLAKRDALRGIGLGLVFIAALVNPKWPLTSLVIGIVFLLFNLRRPMALLAAAATAAAGVGAVAVITDVRLFVFHVFESTFALAAFVDTIRGEWMYEMFPPFVNCPPLLRPLPLLPVAALVVWIALREKATLRFIFIAIAAASLAEILFLYPFPAIDFRYYAFWVFPAAAVLALFPQAAEKVLPPRIAPAFSIACVVVALFVATDIIPMRIPEDPYWRTSEWLLRRLGPNDTLWLNTDRHPIGAPDASYYWFGIDDVTPVMLSLAGGMTQRDLPPCRVERGLDNRVRFIVGREQYRQMPEVERCFDRLRERGAIVRTPVPRVWMVKR